MPFSVWARGDSPSASNASLNAENTNTTPTTLLTFEATAGGDEKLEFNDGLPDPDTIVYVDGDLSNPMTFTMEFGGFLPSSNKLSNVNGMDLRGAEIVILTLENGERLFFLKDSDGSMTWFDTMEAFPNGAHDVTGIYTCYAKGTLIDTPAGARLVEDLIAGDQIVGTDGRAATIRLITSRDFSAKELAAFKMLRPYELTANSPTGDQLARPLIVSAQHRILIHDPAFTYLFGFEAAFVAAQDIPWSVPAPVKDMTYYHFLCDEHECVTANGLVSESLFLGAMTLQSLTSEQRKSIADVIERQEQKTAFPCLSSQEAAVWRADIQSREKRIA